MANSWTIKGKRKVEDVEQIVDIAVVKGIELHDEWMADCYVTGNVWSPEPIDWHFDDFLVYRGEVFSISYDPNVVKKARRGTYGEGFTYENIKLYSLGYKMRNYGFKDVVLYDDIADTAGTLCKAAEVMKEGGAKSVRAVVTHGVLSGEACKRIEESVLEELVCTDSIPFDPSRCSKLHVESLAVPIAQTIRAIQNHTSVSETNIR